VVRIHAIEIKPSPMHGANNDRLEGGCPALAVAVTVFRFLDRSDPALPVRFCDGHLRVGDQRVDMVGFEDESTALASLSYLIEQAGWSTRQPRQLAELWMQSLATGEGHTLRELAAMGRQLGASQSTLDDPLSRWRRTFDRRMEPILESFETVDVLPPASEPQVRGRMLELHPLRSEWPRRLLEDPLWSCAEAPLPGLRPLPLDQAWVEVQLLDGDEVLKRQTAMNLIGALDKAYEERYWLNKPLDHVLERLASSAALIGPPGSGKTTLVKWLARRLITEPQGRFFLPLLAPLRGYATWRGSRPGKEGLVEYALSLCGIRHPEQRALWLNALSYLTDAKRDHVLLLLDGWDEVPVADRLQIQSEIQDLTWGFAVVVTSRPSAHPRQLSIGDVYEIHDLAPEGIEALVRRWFASMDLPGGADPLLDRLDHSPDLKRLARNPFLLTLICGLAYLSSHGRGRVELPSSRSQLYARTLDLIYQQRKAPLAPAHQRQAERLALWLLQDAPGAPRYVFDAGDVVDACGEPDLLDRVLKPARLLRLWNPGSDTYHFLHTTFQEFLAARALSRQPPEEVQSTLRRHGQDAAWQEVFRFLAGFEGSIQPTLWSELRRWAGRPDRFGLIFVRLAPVVAEAGARDGGRALLGVDLREGLWQAIHRRAQVRPLVEAYALIDRNGLISRLERAVDEIDAPALQQRMVRAQTMVRDSMASKHIVDAIIDPGNSSGYVRAVVIESRPSLKDLERLRQAAADPSRSTEVRVRVLTALGELHDAGAVEILTDIAREGGELADPAVEQLGVLGRSEAATALCSLFDHSSEVPWQKSVLKALQRTRHRIARDFLLHQVATRGWVDVLLPDLLSRLAEFPVFRGASILVEGLRSEISQVRMGAAYALGQCTASGVIDALCEVAREDPDETVRQAALESLEGRARPVDSQWLRKRVEDTSRDEVERGLALRALTTAVDRFETTEEAGLLKRCALQAVEAGFAAPRSVLAFETACVAHLAGPEAGPRLLEVVHDERFSSSTRGEACGGLGKLAYQPAVETLLRMVLQDPDAPDDEEEPDDLDGCHHLARKAAEAVTRIDPTRLLDVTGSTADHALWSFALRTGAMVYEHSIVGPDGRVLGAAGHRESGPTIDPDLGLDIGEDQDCLTFQLTVNDSALGPGDLRATSARLRLSPGEFAADLFREVEGLGNRVDVTAEEKLQVKGLRLARELLPPPILERLTELSGAAKVLRLASEEPSLPWELVYLRDSREGGRGAFLCEAFAVSRAGKGTTHDAEWPVKRAGLVVGSDSGLPEQLGERDDLTELLEGHGCIVELVSPTRQAVLEALFSGTYDLLHFIGHGWSHRSLLDVSSLQLSLSDTVEAEDLAAHRCRTRLVFLNGCQTARAGWALTTPAGWAHRFMEAGAVAFLGSAWKISDCSARSFAVSVYRRLLRACPFALAVQEARLELGAGNSTRLAYVAHGDPLGRVRVGS